jgi:Xaa-Pro dipeptidase
MKLSKRAFLKASGAALATLPLTGKALSSETPAKPLTPSTSKVLRAITQGMQAISAKERIKRIAKAQGLMKQYNIAALILEPGAAMDYFSGIQWWRSERLTAVIIPREGEIAVICPFFEEPSIRESLQVGEDVRVWQEHESPFSLVRQILKDRGLDKGKLAFESSVRYFVLSGLMAALPNMQDVSAQPITLGCRMFKDRHELELMHKANEVTLMAYAHTWSQLELGMSQGDVKNIMSMAQTQLGGSGVWNMALFNEASAYPHGTKQEQNIKEGSIVLMDCGCNVHGYQSDISRTFVYGQASNKQYKIWQTVSQGQTIAFEKAQLGTPAGKVDDAVRAFYAKQGLGPGYSLPGLSHRTGHGIGMQGHEPVNFVKGERETLKPGMCFSNEPGIYLPGEFGVRLEDCLYMDNKGPQWFTLPPSSLDNPLGELVPLKVA